MTDLLTRAQARGARAMLGWSIVDLSIAAGVSVASIRRAEDEAGQPVSNDLVVALRRTLETEGVRFLADDGSGAGLRLKPGADERRPRARLGS